MDPAFIKSLRAHAEEATPGPYKCDSSGEVTVIRAPDNSRFAQMTYLTRAGRRNANEVFATAHMLAQLDPATVNTMCDLAEIGLKAVEYIKVRREVSRRRLARLVELNGLGDSLDNMIAAFEEKK